MAYAFRCAQPKEYYRQFLQKRLHRDLQIAKLCAFHKDTENSHWTWKTSKRIGNPVFLDCADGKYAGWIKSPEKKIRADGRELGEFRQTVLNIGSISTAEGSALVRLGNTSVICGVKAELAQPKPETPQEGYVVPNVELSALCSSQFRPGPPGEQAQVLSQLMAHIIRNFHCLPLENLCVASGKLVWALYADLICLDYGGNIIDSCLLALMAALKNTALPTITVDEETQRVSVDVTKHNMLQLTCVPVSASFAVFDDTILLVDPASEEEALTAGTITVVTNGEKVLELNRSGGSGITSEQRQVCITCAFQRHKEATKLVDDTLSSVNR